MVYFYKPIMHNSSHFYYIEIFWIFCYVFNEITHEPWNFFCLGRRFYGSKYPYIGSSVAPPFVFVYLVQHKPVKFFYQILAYLLFQRIFDKQNSFLMIDSFEVILETLAFYGYSVL